MVWNVHAGQAIISAPRASRFSAEKREVTGAASSAQERRILRSLCHKHASMAHPAALFHFRLSGGHGIGRVELLKLWSAACHSVDVAVSRVDSGNANGGSAHTYSLFGPAKQPNIYEVEARMCESLLAALPKATFVLTRY